MERDDRRAAVLKLRQSLADPHPTFHNDSESTPVASSSAIEEESSGLNEAFAAALASPLIDADHPDDP
jgi:hypothetical protein